MTTLDILTRQLACNLQREPLNAIEKAEAVRRLMDEHSITADEAARRVRLPASNVSKTLRLLALPDELKTAIITGKISADSGYLLARLDDPGEQAALAAQVAGGLLTRDALQRKLRRVRRADAARNGAGPNRVTVLLGGGRSVSVAGGDLSFDLLLEILEQVLTRARKSKAQGLSLTTFSRVKRKRKKQALEQWDLSTPLLEWANGASWTIGDACQGAQIFGSTGSGKTSGSLKAIALALLRAGFRRTVPDG